MRPPRLPLTASEANFKSKINVEYERFLFNSAAQNVEEGIDEFVYRQKEMAASCKYGTHNEMIRYRIVLNWDPPR